MNITSTSHIKNTLKHAVIFGGAGLIGKAVGFIMLPIYTHHLQAEGYGVMGMIDAVLSMMNLLIGYGITGSMSRFYYETTDQKRRDSIVSTTIILMFILVITVTLPVLLFNKQVAWLAFGRSDWGHYIVLAAFTFIASMSSRCAENYILIRQRSLFLSFISLGRLFCALSLNIFFIVHLRLGVLGFLYASLIDATTYSLFIHVLVLKQVGLAYDRTQAREALKYSLPLLPGYIAMFFRNNADRVLLRTFLGLAQVGVFEVLFKFATLIAFFAVEPFSKIWQVKRFEICDLKEGPFIMARVFTYHMAVLLFLALIFSLEIPVVLKLLTPKDFWLNGFIVFIAVMSRVLNAAYYHFFFGLLYAKKTFKISLIQIMSAVVSLAMTVPLIRGYGLIGAVVASFLSMIAQCVIAYAMSFSFYRIPFNWGAINRMLALTTCLYLAAKDFTISGTSLAEWLHLTLAPRIVKVGALIHLDHIKGGRILNYLVESLLLLADGTLLLLYCSLFLAGLVFLKVIPRQIAGQVFCLKTLRRPSRLFS